MNALNLDEGRKAELMEMLKSEKVKPKSQNKKICKNLKTPWPMN